MRRGYLAVIALLTVVAIDSSIWQLRQHGWFTKHDSAIASSGKIMGVGIGSTMEETRERLDPLRDGEDDAPEGEKEEGERGYWKLKETEYDWIIAWADGRGKIVRLRAMLRQGVTKRFSEIGDLRLASTANPNIAKWKLRAADGTNYRLVAQGTEGRAATVYMFSVDLPAQGGGE